MSLAGLALCMALLAPLGCAKPRADAPRPVYVGHVRVGQVTHAETRGPDGTHRITRVLTHADGAPWSRTLLNVDGHGLVNGTWQPAEAGAVTYHAVRRQQHVVLQGAPHPLSMSTPVWTPETVQHAPPGPATLLDFAAAAAAAVYITHDAHGTTVRLGDARGDVLFTRSPGEMGTQHGPGLLAVGSRSPTPPAAVDWPANTRKVALSGPGLPTQHVTLPVPPAHDAPRVPRTNAASLPLPAAVRAVCTPLCPAGSDPPGGAAFGFALSSALGRFVDGRAVGGVPTAAAVVERGAADCDGVTALGLACAAHCGVPARAVHGVVRGADGKSVVFHAWAAVWDGAAWFDVDIARRKLGPDAARIPLGRGLGSMFDVGRLLGTLHVQPTRSQDTHSVTAPTKKW